MGDSSVDLTEVSGIVQDIQSGAVGTAVLRAANSPFIKDFQGLQADQQRLTQIITARQLELQAVETKITAITAYLNSLNQS